MKAAELLFFSCVLFFSNRRSGLKDKLNSTEIRRLTDKLRKKGKGYENFIEYDK
jgi:hypothetical protein